MDPAVHFDRVSKRFVLGSHRAYLRYLLPSFRRRLAQADPAVDVPGELWALRDVSFEVSGGQVFGLIGANGAGKTTALSMLAGVISPTLGRITVRGRIGALIKLGAGFHPDLTGRENVYLNASILGLRRREIDRLYDEIVEFAGLERFMDTPVKRYSSGMYVRLGFAVAAHIRPDVLLVDEVLSVGDVSFQARCFNKIGEIRDQGATIIFVSHNMHQISSFCDRVAYLRNGRLERVGEPGEVLTSYTRDVMSNRLQERHADGSDMSQVHGSGALVITAVEFHDAAGRVVTEIRSGEPLTLRVYYESRTEVVNPLLDVVMRDGARGNMFQATNRDFGIEFGTMGREGYVEISFNSLPCNNETLNFFLTFWNSRHTEQYDWKRFLKLQVVGNPLSSGRMLFDSAWRNVTLPPSAGDMAEAGVSVDAPSAVKELRST